MKKALPAGEEKFFRTLDKHLSPHTPFSLLTLSEEEGFAGKRKGRSFFFYRRKKRLFSLFRPVLFGKTEKDGVKWRVGRTLPLTLLCLFWGGILGGTGLALISVEWDFALYFLLPAAAIFFFLFFISKKEKALLEAYLDQIINGGTK